MNRIFFLFLVAAFLLPNVPNLQRNLWRKVCIAIDVARFNLVCRFQEPDMPPNEAHEGDPFAPPIANVCAGASSKRRNLLLIRHGESTMNALSDWTSVGHGLRRELSSLFSDGTDSFFVDPPLTDEGARQAASLGARLPTLLGGRNFTVMVSNMRRALETAHIALTQWQRAARHRPAGESPTAFPLLHVDSDLEEIGCGGISIGGAMPGPLESSVVLRGAAADLASFAPLENGHSLREFIRADGNLGGKHTLSARAWTRQDRFLNKLFSSSLFTDTDNNDDHVVVIFGHGIFYRWLVRRLDGLPDLHFPNAGSVGLRLVCDPTSGRPKLSSVEPHWSFRLFFSLPSVHCKTCVWMWLCFGMLL